MPTAPTNPVSELTWRELLNLSLLSITLTLVSINVILTSGLVGDDAYNSQIRGVLLVEGTSVLEKFITVTEGWILGAGRFFPLHWYPIFLYYFVDSPITIKILTVAFVSFGILITGLIVRQLTQSQQAGKISIIISAAVLQMRIWHDPILSFSFLLPLLYLLFALSLLFFLWYLHDARKRNLLLASITHALGLLIYEATYPLILIIVLISWAHRGNLRDGFRAALPMVIISLLIVSISIGLKTDLNPNFSNLYPGANLSISLRDNLYAFIIQLLSGIPLSYFFSNPGQILKSISTITLLSALIPTAIIGVTLSKIEPVKKRVLSGLYILGVGLFILPALLISVSGKKTELIEIGLGYGYLPVYIQYFGVSVLLSALALTHLRSSRGLQGVKRYLLALVVIVFYCVSVVHIAQNRYVARSTDEFYKYPREMLALGLTQLQAHKSFQPSDAIIRTSRYPHDQQWFISQSLGRKAEVYEADGDFSELHDGHISTPELETGVYAVVPAKRSYWTYSYNGNGSRSDYFMLARVDVLYIGNEGRSINSILVREIYYLDRASGKLERINHQAPLDFVKILSEQGLLKGASIVDRITRGNYDFDGLNLRWVGTHGIDGSIIESVRWSSANSELIITNFSDSDVSIKIEFGLLTGYDRGSEFEIYVNDSLYSKTVINNVASKVNIELKVMKGKVATLRFKSSERRFPNTDPRAMVFGFTNMRYAASNTAAK